MSTQARRYYRGHTLSAMRDTSAGSTGYYHFDHQGTTQALSDSSGAGTARFAADGWGVQSKRTGSSINRHWFIGAMGYYHQPDSPLLHVRARYLSTQIARWTSVDPATSSVDANPYQYASNQPVEHVDPSGTQKNGKAPPPACTAVVTASVKALFNDPLYAGYLGGGDFCKSDVIMGQSERTICFQYLLHGAAGGPHIQDWCWCKATFSMNGTITLTITHKGPTPSPCSINIPLRCTRITQTNEKKCPPDSPCSDPLIHPGQIAFTARDMDVWTPPLTGMGKFSADLKLIQFTGRVNADLSYKRCVKRQACERRHPIMI